MRRDPRPLCLIVTNNFPPVVGGAGEVYAALAAASGGRIGVLCAARSYLTGAEIPGWRAHDAAACYPVERIAHIRPRLRGPRGRLTRALALLTEELPIRLALFARVAWMRVRDGFRVLCIADDETVGWLAGPARRLLGCRIVLYTHGDDLAVRPGDSRLRARRHRQFLRADAIVAVSGAAALGLEQSFGVPRDRVTVIPNGIDLAVFRPVQTPAATHTIATVARLVPRKGVDRVIAALPLLRATLPDLRYLVIGDGPQRAELEALAARLGVADQVRFVGSVAHEAVPEWLAQARLMVMPNRRMPDGEDEGFGLVFLEANACGLPVIGGRAGGVPEVVEDGVNGLLVDGEDPAAIAAAIARVLTEPGLAARLAAGGLARARAAGWPERAGAFIALCESLIGRGPSRAP